MDRTTQHNMLHQKALSLFTCLLALTSLILALPPGTPWTNFAFKKPVYSRAIASGPSAQLGMGTISVPYMPKSPFFPKFVDPKTMISKKTDMLSNLFGGLGPVAFNVADTKPMPYDFSESSLGDIDNADLLLKKKLGSLFNVKEKKVLSESSLDGTDNTDSSFKTKRGSPLDVKEKKVYDSGMYKRGMFGPFASKFGPAAPMGPKFGPPMPFFPTDMIEPDYTMGKGAFYRKRRSIESPVDYMKSFFDKSPTATFSPSPNLKIPKIEENSPVMKRAPSADSDVPKEYLPGVFGPFGPVVDPNMFMSKKSALLDTLFKNLATTTPATTEAPVPKSTIVPPSFWMPSSAIADPSEYTSKVSEFLEKLFDSLKMNTTATKSADKSEKSYFMRSLDDTTSDRIARSSEGSSSKDAIMTAKDTVVDSILMELSNLKNDMMATMNDLIAYEKTMATATMKKPFKPFAGFWSKPTAAMDPTLPFQQRMAVLSQVFDMLTDLQRNVTAAARNAIITNDEPDNSEVTKAPLAADTVDAVLTNTTLLNMILKKLSTVVNPSSDVEEGLVNEQIMSRALPKSFWVSYPEDSIDVAKRQTDDYSPFPIYENDHQNQRQYARGVKMQMHQGYQSLPAGSVESVQAGGGSTPEHQGGGIKLLGSNAYGNLNKWADWMQYHKNEYEDQEHRRHHHSHH